MVKSEKTRSEIGHYLAGFIDGEGSFHVSFQKNKGYGYRLGWIVVLGFTVTQKEPSVLELCKTHLECGTVTFRKRNTPGQIREYYEYRVDNLKDHKTKVIPFFNTFGFLSIKKNIDFSCYKQIAELMLNRDHLYKPGLTKIVELRTKMHEAGGRKHKKYSAKEILDSLKDHDY